ncbi:hypothetical protein ncot_16235 [Nocardioides sp. JQ2195]|uniref:hypothetical protein n=1 Tax=Nocardioides sp. JQ2195 TaxID=2592334 RepID=UPI00143E104A|nr:hypothetical protein [Nocardioides sp. JQ2195]QIX27965.1 hypothetical protein ncot_16235 [Nocardioides sp. JQ2195]
MDVRALQAIQEHQAGVISRRQVVACGGTDRDIARLVRRRTLTRVMTGVYVDHNGPLSWEQSAWAVVLRHWPAALTGGSALVAHGLRLPRFLRAPGPTAFDALGPTGDAPTGRRRGATMIPGVGVDVMVEAHRRPDRVAGVRLTRSRNFDDLALLHLSPPRVRLEHAVLEVASRAPDEAAAVGVLSDAVQSRRTTAQRLLVALELRPRMRHRKLLLRLLADVSSGAFSALEQRYLVDVERRHGLPTARRQRRERRERGVVFRDADYEKYAVIVELDGRLGHEWSDDAGQDLDRDIDALIDQRVTVRARWHQVLDPCRLAAALVRILWARGWTGRPRSCGADCAVGLLLRAQPPDSGGFHADSA